MTSSHKFPPLLLALALVAVLGRLVAQGSGPPTPETGLAAVLFVLVATSVARRSSPARGPWSGVMTGLAAALLGVAGLSAGFASRSMDLLQFGWLLGVVLPGFLAWTWSRTSGPMARGVLPGLLVCVGMVALAAPPTESRERAVWVAALGLLLPLLMTTRLLGRRSVGPSGVLPWSGPLLVAVMVVLLTAALGRGLEGLVHTLRAPASDHLGLDPLELQGMADVTVEAAGPLARVRCLPPPGAPTLLYLRDRALAQARLAGGEIDFLERTGPVQRVVASADRHADGWVDLQGDPRHAQSPDEALSEYQITLLAPQVPRLLLPPHVHRIELDQVLLQADASIPRPRHAGPFSYRLHADPTAYRGTGLRGATARGSSTDLALPEDLPEAEAWKQALAPVIESAREDGERARLLERHLRNQGRFAVASPDGPAELLLVAQGTQPGDSWSFAKAFCVMARLAGLPARPVVGYRLILDAAGQAEVRRATAWAWAEIAFADTGWVAFDPTPVPEADGDTDDTAAAWNTGEGASGDAARDPRFQVDPSTGTPARSWTWLPWLMAGVGLIGGSLWWRQRQAPARASRPPTGPARQAWRYWRQFLTLCARRGWVPGEGTTPKEFIGDLTQRIPGVEADLQDLVGTYYGCRFGGADLDGHGHQRLRQLLGRLATALRKVTPTQPAAPTRSTR